MESINKFDEIAKHPKATEEIREYAIAMREFLIKLELLNYDSKEIINQAIGFIDYEAEEDVYFEN